MMNDEKKKNNKLLNKNTIVYANIRIDSTQLFQYLLNKSHQINWFLNLNSLIYNNNIKTSNKKKIINQTYFKYFFYSNTTDAIE